MPDSRHRTRTPPARAYPVPVPRRRDKPPGSQSTRWQKLDPPPHERLTGAISFLPFPGSTPHPERVVLHHTNLVKGVRVRIQPVRSCSPAVGRGDSDLAALHAQGVAPFRLLRAYGGCTTMRCVAWSADSRWVIVGSKDLTAWCTGQSHRRVRGRRWPDRERSPRWRPRGRGETAYTVSKDGALFEWRLEDDDKDAEAPERGPGGRPVAGTTENAISGNTFSISRKADALVPPPPTRCARIGHGVFTMHRLGPDTFEHADTFDQQGEGVLVCVQRERRGIATARDRANPRLSGSQRRTCTSSRATTSTSTRAYAPDGSMLPPPWTTTRLRWSTATGSCFVTLAEHTAPGRRAVSADTLLSARPTGRFGLWISRAIEIPAC